MCSTCGCGDDAGTRVTTLFAEQPGQARHSPSHPDGHPDDPRHHHDHHHQHRHDDPTDQDDVHPTETVVLEQQILAKNDTLAAHNRGWLSGREITALNVMSSPGSGKTTLLARTISEMSQLPDPRPFSVIEGDQETLLDAERIRATGAPVVQINTGAGCHLDAGMLRRGLDSLSPPHGSVLFIENVGNLVCPALFDLGETARVVVISVTEGMDKPLKYPQMFAAADLVVINKSDLLPYVDFDVDTCVDYARRVRPGVPWLVLSATTGAGTQQWYEWVAAWTR
jgi:hydrogenase nickel incorporation protein HypB